MNSIKLCMIATLGLAVTMIVKQWKSDFLPLIRIGMTVLFATAILTSLSPLIGQLSQLCQGEATQYVETLLKALGIAVLTQICSGICRDAGESAIAEGVELTGQIELLLLALPLISQILSTASDLLSLGG